MVETLVEAEKITFSFDQFVGYLGTIDLRNSDVHYRTQTHQLERELSPGSVFIKSGPFNGVVTEARKLSRLAADRSTTIPDIISSRYSLPGAPPQFIGDQLFEFSDRGQASVPDYVASITVTWSSAFTICMQRTFFAMDFRQL